MIFSFRKIWAALSLALIFWKMSGALASDHEKHSRSFCAHEKAMRSFSLLKKYKKVFIRIAYYKKQDWNVVQFSPRPRGKVPCKTVIFCKTLKVGQKQDDLQNFPRLQDCKTTRLQDCKTTRLQDCKTTRLLDYKTARLLDYKTARLQAYIFIGGDMGGMDPL